MLREQRRRREEFHGKTVLTEFYKEQLHSAGLSQASGSLTTGFHLTDTANTTR